MPVSSSICLSGVSWSTPDGRCLFSDLDLAVEQGLTGLVGPNGVGKTVLFSLIAGQLRPRTGTVTVTGTIGWLRQSVHGYSGTIARLFGVEEALACLHRIETGVASDDDYADADWTVEDRLRAALDRAGLSAGPDTRMETLSGGQGLRADLAALLFRNPGCLLLDEPTNTLDADGRRRVRDLLAGWRGCALVISHDRTLLDGMDAIVELSPHGATRYGGNWTAYQARKALDCAAAERVLADAGRHLEQVEQAAQAIVERKARRDGAGRRERERGGMPKIAQDFRKNRSDRTTSRLTRTMDDRRADASEAVKAARQRLEAVLPLRMQVPPTGLPAGKIVLRLESVWAGYVPDCPVVQGVSVTLTGPERVALCGGNGSGKTTLLSVVQGTLPPWSGMVRLGTPPALLDQTVSMLNPTETLEGNFWRLNPRTDLNACRAALARFGFRGEAALLPVGTLSGGQKMRAGLACILGGAAPPSLLLLDEPSNHLDLEALRVLEAGLRAYDGALLVVSHDEAFLEAIGIERRVVMPTRAFSAKVGTGFAAENALRPSVRGG